MGARLGRYVVLKHLVSGGMADVLLGRTDGIEGFERHVVLKRIRPEHARDQRFIRMFLDEARVAASLHHQHIVQVHDIGEAHGEYFIAMEYLHGEDVRTILSKASKTRAHVPLGYAVAIVSAAAAGLHYAHERRGSDKQPLGIVHCDVSPSNILVGYDGSIKVVDFGIAKAAMRQETRSGSLKGKVSYMSPEQCKSDGLDRRSDVYALGVVLYELATTTRLFKGENDYLVMDQIVNGRVSLPRVRRPDLPDELSSIIMRALATDRERRYVTADELRVALDQFAAREGLTASTSQIAAYMRKQFGERPEPWLEIGGMLDDAPTPVVDSGVPRSWTDLPRSEDSAPRGGLIASPSGAIRAVSERPSSPLMPQDAVLHVPVVRLPSTPPATESKMGWESQQPAPEPRAITPARLAVMCVPLALILGVAIWRLTDTGNTGSPAALVASRTPPPSAPVVTALPDPAPPAAAVAPANPANPTNPAAGDPIATVAARGPEPAPAVPLPRRGFAPPSRKLAAVKGAAAAAPAPGAKAEGPGTAPPATAVAQGSGAPPGALSPVPAGTPPAPAAAPPAPAAPAPAPRAAAPAVTPAPTATLLAAASFAATPPATAGAAPPSPAVASPPQVVDMTLPQLPQALVEHVASDHTRELSKCDGGEDLHGEIMVKFAVDPSGKVTKAQVATKIKKPKVIACILRVLQGWRFPRQGVIGAQGTYTLSFQ
jgi:serine/threonine protein kinase